MGLSTKWTRMQWTHTYSRATSRKITTNYFIQKKLKGYIISATLYINIFDNAVGLLAFAQRLQIKDLMKQTQKFLNSNLRDGNYDQYIFTV